jgi:hypothetical protein
MKRKCKGVTPVAAAFRGGRFSANNRGKEYPRKSPSLQSLGPTLSKKK